MNSLIESKLEPIAAMPLNCQSLGLLAVKENLASVGKDLLVNPPIQSLANECGYVYNYYANGSKRYVPSHTSHTSFQPPEELKKLLMPTRNFTDKLRKKMDEASAQVLRHGILNIKKNGLWNSFKGLDQKKQLEMVRLHLLNDVNVGQLKPEVQARLLCRCQQAFDTTFKTFEQGATPPDLVKQLSLFQVADEVEAKFSLNEALQAKRERQAQKETLAKINKYCGITSAIEQGLLIGISFAEQHADELEMKKEHFQMLKTGVKVVSVVTQAAINLSMGNLAGAAGALINGFSQSPEEAIANRHREIMSGLVQINDQIHQVQVNQRELRVEVRHAFATIADLLQAFQADHNRHFAEISSQLATIQQDQMQIYDRIEQVEQTILEAIKNLQIFTAQKLQAAIGLNLEVIYFKPCNSGKAFLDSFQRIETTFSAFKSNFILQKEHFRSFCSLFNDGFMLNELHIPTYLKFATWGDEESIQWMRQHYYSQLSLLKELGIEGPYSGLAYPFETFIDLLDTSLQRRGNPLLEKCLTLDHFKDLLFPEALAHLSAIFVPLLPFFTFAEDSMEALNLENIKMEHINKTKEKIEAFLGRVQLAIAQFNLIAGDNLIKKVGDELVERLNQPGRQRTPVETLFIKHALEKGKMANPLFARNLGKWLVLRWQMHKSQEFPSAWLDNTARMKEFFGPHNVVKEDPAYEGHDGWHFTFTSGSDRWTIPMPNLRDFKNNHERIELPLIMGELIRLRSRLTMQHLEYERALKQDRIHQRALKLFAFYNFQ